MSSRQVLAVVEHTRAPDRWPLRARRAHDLAARARRSGSPPHGRVFVDIAPSWPPRRISRRWRRSRSGERVVAAGAHRRSGARTRPPAGVSARTHRPRPACAPALYLPGDEPAQLPPARQSDDCARRRVLGERGDCLSAPGQDPPGGQTHTQAGRSRKGNGVGGAQPHVKVLRGLPSMTQSRRPRGARAELATSAGWAGCKPGDQ